METQRLLLYIHRRDVRLSDNPIYYHISKFLGDSNDDRPDSVVSDNGSENFTHLLPIYVFPAQSVETSGFLTEGQTSPYPEARSSIAKVWRTGPHRARFLAEGAWDLKNTLEGLGSGSGLVIRVGTIEDVVKHALDWYCQKNQDDNVRRVKVGGIWMTNEEGTEEKDDETAVRRLADHHGVEFKLWHDEKYYIDDRELPFNDISGIPETYSNYRKMLEPLRKRPRELTKTPTWLPPLPSDIPPQHGPFEIPDSITGLKECLIRPFTKDPGLTSPPVPPRNLGQKNGHPFTGGESEAQKRLSGLIRNGAMGKYKETRNGMLGPEYSTKISAYLSQGHFTARQVHWAMVDFEEGRGEGKQIPGFGQGENDGTYAVRFELLWRDYMRILQRKYRARMFNINGILDPAKAARVKWRYLDGTGGPSVTGNPEKAREDFARFCAGTTGMGLIDASQRELFLTGYTSNRARQNVASFLAKHLNIDWRVGAEWYEFLLVDYDVCNNWGNWQYVAGVGNDPRQNRLFNPVKQALDYDKEGEFIKAWVPELEGVPLHRLEATGEIDPESLMGLYQAWRLPAREKENLKLKGLDWVDRPLHPIKFSPKRSGNPKGQSSHRGQGSWRGGSRQARDFRRAGQEEKFNKWCDCT